MNEFSIFSNALGYKDYKLWAYERAKFANDWNSKIHNHSYTEIFFIINGEGYLRTPTKDTPVHKGSVVVVNPNTLHTEVSDPSESLEYAVFSIGNLRFTDEDSENKEDIFYFDFLDEYDEILGILQELEKEETEKKPFWQFAVLSLTDRFLLYILRRANLSTHPYSADEKISSVSNIFLYIASRYQDEITLDKISKLFYLNKYYIAHAFKEKYGKTIIGMLNEIRCNEAEQLLKSGTLSISEIATTVGFNSISYFSSVYKKYKGETPEQTRRG